MILSKAPLRVSLFGGGSDIPAFYERFDGATVSMAIDKYVYVAVMYTPHNHIKVSYSKQEVAKELDEVQNEIVRECLRAFNIQSNIEITSFADIPTVGTGLGGSSAFTCALIRALAEYTNVGRYYNSFDIGSLAADIEINKCGWNIGVQDQYASAFGGSNYMQYSANSKVDQPLVRKIDLSSIASKCLLIPTNISRHSSEIIDSISFDKEEETESIKKLVDLAEEFITSEQHWYDCGKLLDKAWQVKKNLSTMISNPAIDDIYERCTNAGAVGCKLLGAGGGGYMLAITNSVDSLYDAFDDRIPLSFAVSEEGAKVVYRD